MPSISTIVSPTRKIKDQSEKKVTNVDAYISVVFSHILVLFKLLKMQISVAFQRG